MQPHKSFLPNQWHLFPVQQKDVFVEYLLSCRHATYKENAILKASIVRIASGNGWKVQSDLNPVTKQWAGRIQGILLDDNATVLVMDLEV